MHQVFACLNVSITLARYFRSNRVHEKVIDVNRLLSSRKAVQFKPMESLKTSNQESIAQSAFMLRDF